MIVNSGLTAMANLVGGTTSGEYVLAVGFGSGSRAAAMGDTGLSATPTYYKAIDSGTIGPAGGVASGSVVFGYSLLTTDYAANPITIAELGFFGNTGGALFPAAVGTANPAWATGTSYSVGNMIVDSNGNIQRCTTAGTSSGGAHPVWPTTVGQTVADGLGTLFWTCVAVHTAPTPMISHLVVPSFPYSGGGDFSGTYTISL